MIDELILDMPELTGAQPAEVITDDGRAFLGSSSFTVAIDPKNDGVVLTRRYDPISTDQRAAILVDGEKVAEWTGEAATSGGWVEESVLLPASATAGKSEIRVTNEFISAGMDFSEFRYFVDSTIGGEQVRTDEVDVGPFETGLASEEAHDYEIVDQQWEGDRVNILPSQMENEEEVAATDALLEGLRLRVTVDGQRTVDSPVGEFFGTGLGQYDVSSLMTAVDAETGRYSSWWSMPFAADARIELVNTSKEPLTAGRAELTWAQDDTVAERLQAVHPSLGYFRTSSRDGEVTEGEDWTFLDVEGQGRFLGVHHTMESLDPQGNTRGYLEGDERFHADGLATPQWYGTGTEDFYEGGWYFNRGPFSNPMNGAPAAEAAGMYGCEIQCDAAYRLLIGDAIDFQQGITTGVEPGPESNHSAFYSSTAFWYGHQTPAATVTDSIHVGDAESESAHDYSGGGELRTLASVFEGDHDDVEVTDTVRDADGTVRFTLAVDENATGVRLIRRADQATAGQAAEVRIDRKKVGTWFAPLGNEHQRWVEDSFDLPRKVTRGKREITVEITPLKDTPSWTAARYDALSIGTPGQP